MTGPEGQARSEHSSKGLQVRLGRNSGFVPTAWNRLLLGRACLTLEWPRQVHAPASIGQRKRNYSEISYARALCLGGAYMSYRGRRCLSSSGATRCLRLWMPTNVCRSSVIGRYWLRVRRKSAGRRPAKKAPYSVDPLKQFEAKHRLSRRKLTSLRAFLDDSELLTFPSRPSFYLTNPALDSAS